MRAKVREYVRNTVEETRRAAEQNAEAIAQAQEVCGLFESTPGPIFRLRPLSPFVVTVIAMAYASFHCRVCTL